MPAPISRRVDPARKVCLDPSSQVPAPEAQKRLASLRVRRGTRSGIPPHPQPLKSDRLVVPNNLIWFVLILKLVLEGSPACRR